jgi:hypothetical protein
MSGSLLALAKGRTAREWIAVPFEDLSGSRTLHAATDAPASSTTGHGSPELRVSASGQRWACDAGGGRSL